MKKFALVFTLICLFLLSGCTGYREIDRGYLATAIAFKQTDNVINITVEALSSSDVIDNPSQKVILSAKGKTIDEAYHTLKSQLTKPLYFEQLGALILEQSLDNPLALQAIDFCSNLPSVSLGLFVVTTPDLQSLLDTETPSGALGYDIIGLIKNYNKINNLNATNRLYQLQRKPSLGDGLLLPCVTTQQDNLNFKPSGE